MRTRTAGPATRGVAAHRAGPDPGWSISGLQAVHSGLLQDAELLRQQVGSTAQLLADPLTTAPPGADDDVAHAVHAADLEGQVVILENAQALLAQTERALRRVEDGSYPFCDTCGETVGRPRQEAFPRAVTCLSCKEREERR